MKKLISSMLTLSLLAGGSSPAMTALAAPAVSASSAQGALDERLSTVTKAVKSVLPIPDDLPEFYGEANENDLAPRWDLSWSGDSERISVTAGEDGTVYSYNYNATDNDRRRFWGLDAAFPKADEKKALNTAQQFVNRLMGANESAELKPSDSGSADSLTFTGTLLFHDLPSPVSVRVTIRSADLTVTNYYRSDSYPSTYPEVPSPTSSTSSAQAAELLRSSIQLTPYYVLEKDQKTASLRYVQEEDTHYIVTAADGKLVDLKEVYKDLVTAYREDSSTKFAMSETTGDAGAASSGGARLSDAESKTIEGLKDVHSREQLDSALRGIPALGLGSAWALERVSYTQDRETGDISAQLRYTRPLTEDERAELKGDYEGELLQIRKTVQMDARTDALQSLYTTNYYELERAIQVRNSPQTEAQRRAAEEFLAAQLPEKWKSSAPYSREGDNRLLYAHEVNGYLFPENLLAIRMDTDNTVESLNVTWNPNVVFSDANGILSEEEAVNAYQDAYDMPLSYVEYPVLETNRIMAQKYVLAYVFRDEENRSFRGIDAKSGEPVWEDYRSSEEYQYTDLSGAFGRKQIEALAAYGVGLPGDEFRPEAVLDQKTMLALLLSACGDKCDPESEDGLDDLYSMAYSENLIKAADRDPDAEITRIGFLRTLLGASIYGDAAKVPGIYSSPFTDSDDLASEDLGYASLAHGLGIARGDDKGKLNPDRTITRQEAAVMLYNFMMR